VGVRNYVLFQMKNVKYRGALCLRAWIGRNLNLLGGLDIIAGIND
jgi:hypothetical protein